MAATRLHPVYRLIACAGRFIGVLTVIAFQAQPRQPGAETTRSGGLGGYVWMVPVAAILAAIGVARRHRTELPIHDRQTDVIVGTMGLVLALLLHGVLLQRYALYFHLLRLDLVAMWMFVLSGSIALFGLRPVIRFAWVWAGVVHGVPAAVLRARDRAGRRQVAAGAGTLSSRGSRPGSRWAARVRRGLIGVARRVGRRAADPRGAWRSSPPTHRCWPIRLIPAMTAIVPGRLVLFSAGAPRRATNALLDRKIEPLAAGQVWAALPVVLVVAIARPGRLSVIGRPGRLRAALDAMACVSTPRSPRPPAGRSPTPRTYPWVNRLYGRRGHPMRQQQMVAEVGDPRVGQIGRPRTVMVDTITTDRPFSFNVYPAPGALRRRRRFALSALRPVDLGYGVNGRAWSPSSTTTCW